MAEIDGISVFKGRGEKKTIVTQAGMHFSPSKLTADDYSLPEPMNDYICVMCGNKVGFYCSLCGCTLDFPDEQVACGFGHICWECWDELPENPQPKGDGE